MREDEEEEDGGQQEEETVSKDKERQDEGKDMRKRKHRGVWVAEEEHSRI